MKIVDDDEMSKAWNEKAKNGGIFSKQNSSDCTNFLHTHKTKK
jgi:hypothetical protein